MLNMNLQFFAHKKGVGSTKNGRDSESKRLGAKRADGQFVVWALTALHGIGSPTAGFLHHDRLYHRDVFGDSILIGVFLDG